MFTGGQVHRLPLGQETARGQVQHDAADRDLGRAQARLAAQQRPDAGLELGDLEGLDHVVVGPQVQASDAFLGRAAGGQDHHRGRVAAGAHAAQHLQPVHLWQVQVQDHQVEPFRRDQRLGRGAVIDVIDGMPRTGQKLHQPVGQRRVVLDQQNAHRPSPRRRS